MASHVIFGTEVMTADIIIPVQFYGTQFSAIWDVDDPLP